MQHAVARRKFGKFKNGDPRAVRQQKATKDPMMERLLKSCERFAETLESNKERIDRIQFELDRKEGHEIASSWFLECIGNLEYSAEDIEKLSLSPPDGKLLEDGVFGAFFDMLLFHGKDNEYTVHCLDWSPYELGDSNSKKIVVHGECSDVGSGMFAGEITVSGRAEGLGSYMEGGVINAISCREAGRKMKDGLIKVSGDVHTAGGEMAGGKIEIGGNCEYLGRKMEGGLIVVKKDVRFASKILGGKIHVHGNLETVFDIEGGTLVVDGNADSVGNTMKGGEIIVKGNCCMVGQGMSGGKVTVHGNVNGIWPLMRGGEVHVHGDLEFMGLIDAGKVYHKGKLIVDK